MTDHAAIAFYRGVMEQGTGFLGYTTMKYEQVIAKLCKQTGARTLLDYGCGKGLQYSDFGLHKKWALRGLALYDPSWPAHAAKPRGTFDGVICIDVLEHIPEDDLERTLAELHGYARRFLLCSICCRAAKKFMPDGRNVHVTVRPRSWWKKMFRLHAREGLIVKIKWTE